ncbi:MAG: hypothetical protein CMO40_08520 [Verrucomicrobiaceae bacterium]|nr:hypothetical protein [Verrucomicrobiaceae bacterium]
MKQFFCHLQFVLALSLLFTSPTAAAGEASLPVGFRFVGNYQLEKRIKVRDGKPFQVRSNPFVCRIYTDGIMVRVYGESGGEGFTSFTIYRNDGVLVGAGTSHMETVPGIQAHSLVGNLSRQLTLTEEQLVLTKFPGLSDVVEITYANRRITVGHKD